MGTEIQINFNKNKEIAIELFHKVVLLFEKYTLDYWIEYGTLLGALREKGLILWDSEFDVGVWHEKYSEVKVRLETDFKNLGFYLDYGSKDRIKLKHHSIRYCSYTIDIHTYHKKEDVAFVSFNRRKLTFNENLRNALMLFDNRIKTYYPASNQIKVLLNTTNEIPSVYLFKTGKFNSHKSFIIKTEKEEINYENGVIERKPYFYKMFFEFMYHFFSALPKKLKFKTIDLIYSIFKIKEIKYKNIQAIPLDFFENLDKISFEGLEISCPKFPEKYIETVYGADWKTPKMGWVNSQNKINRKV